MSGDRTSGRPRTPRAGYRSALRPPPRHRPTPPSPPDDGKLAFEPLDTPDGRPLGLRPIRSGDAAALQRAFLRLTPAQVRARFFHRIVELDDDLAARLSRPNDERSASFVVVDADAAGAEEIRGEARVHFDAVTESGEFAIVVDPDFLGVGIGRALLLRLVRECRARNVRELWGDVLADNHAMLAFVRQLGFEHSIERGDDAGVVRIRLRWPGAGSTAAADVA